MVLSGGVPGAIRARPDPLARRDIGRRQRHRTVGGASGRAHRAGCGGTGLRAGARRARRLAFGAERLWQHVVGHRDVRAGPHHAGRAKGPARLRHVLRPGPGGGNHDVPHGGVTSPMGRVLTPEILDVLPPDDPRALRSRRDLTLINAVMRQSAIMAKALSALPAPRLVADLGGGDGRFMLRVAGAWRSAGPSVTVLIADRRASSARQTRAGFAGLGWSCEKLTGDVCETLPLISPTSSPPTCSCITWTMRRWRGCWRWWRVRPGALSPASRGARPLRCWARGMVFALGANDVTRHDAWPACAPVFAAANCPACGREARRAGGLREHGVFPFTHLFHGCHHEATGQKMRYDAVIVGAGPAGAAAARLLAQGGLVGRAGRESRISPPQGVRRIHLRPHHAGAEGLRRRGAFHCRGRARR